MIGNLPVLLLTGSIVPHTELSKKGRVDVGKRENDYFDAIQFYLKEGFRVVYVDNSNTQSEKILGLKRKYQGLEYHCFVSTRSHLGKSQGEVEIINYALVHSKHLSSVDYLVKITGRYIIKNICKIFEGTNNVESEVFINPTRNLRWADSRLMIMRKSYYEKYFLDSVSKYLDESKGVFMENVFMKSLFLFLLDGGQLRLWPSYPAYKGMDGTHDEPVTFGFLKTIKYNLYYKFKKFAFGHRA